MSQDPSQTHAVAANQLVVGEGVRIQGTVNAPGVVHLLGCLEGDLVAGELLVSETGELIGSVVADQIEIRGRVRQNVTGSKSIAIRSTARIEGEVKYAELEIEAGAQIEGALRRISEDAPETAMATDGQ